MLVYSTPSGIYSSALRLNSAGDKLVFAQKVDGTSDNNLEIFVLKDWYGKLGFVEISTMKFPHLPFTVCFMEGDSSPL